MTVSQPIHILYIGDKEPTSHLLMKTLDELGYTLSQTTDVRQAAPVYQEADCQAVLFDQAGVDEDSFLQKISALASLPLIAILPAGQEALVPAALDHGANDYLIRDQAEGYLALVPIVVERVIHQDYLAQQNQLVEAAIEENLIGIERAKQEWEATIDSLPQLICLLDDQGRVIRANLTVELWELAPVIGIRGREFDQLLEMGDQWLAAWEMVHLGRPTEFEYMDPHLQRYLAVQLRPLSTQTSRRDKLSGSFAAVVVEDVSQRKEAEESLRQYAYQLEAHNQDLDAFAHTVAHDLQNPLGLVIGFSSALSKHYERLTSEEVGNYLHKIMETSRKMSNIIKELLLLASVRQQDVDLEPLDMVRVLKEARSRLSVFIADYEAELILPDHWPIALGYSPWIEEVWVNYISNAIKYGGRPPRLTFGASMEADGMVRFWIQDNGPGLTDEEQSRLFQPFTRLHREQIQGHGLGLSIVQRIITKLGGRVAVYSEGIPGKGTIFSFTLPSPEYSILTNFSES